MATGSTKVLTAEERERANQLDADLEKKRLSSKQRILHLQPEVITWEAATVSPHIVELRIAELTQIDYKLHQLHDDAANLCSTPADFIPHDTEFQTLFSALDKVRADVMKIAAEQKILNQAKSSPAAFKLEKVQLPKFSGDFTQWQSFRDLFRTSVHKHPTLSGAEKMVHLKSCLTGDAASLVSSFRATDDQYKEAWITLCNRYNNSREIVFAHLKKFDTLKGITTESASGLRSISDGINDCIRSLKVMKIPVENWDIIIIYYSLKKLDNESRKEWSLSQKTDLPKLQQFVEFLEARARALADSNPNSSASTKTQAKAHNSNASASTSGTRRGSNHSSSPTTCHCCAGNHPLFKCGKFSELSAVERAEAIKGKQICNNCFSSNHATSKCDVKGSCRICHKRHNTLLHREEKTESKATTVTTASLNTGNSSPSCVLLSTAMVKVTDSSNGFRVCRVLLDPGSESSFITDKCVKSLGFQPTKCNVEITGISSSSVGKAKGQVELNVKSLHKDFNFNVTALVLSKVTGRLPSFTMCGESLDYIRGLSLADPKFLEPREVDILLGADVTGFLWLTGRVMKDRASPIACETELGWVVSGPVSTGPTQRTNSMFSIRVHHANVDCQSIVKRFWELEEVPHHPQLTAEEKKCESHFIETHSRTPSGRYIAPLPYNSNIDRLGASRHMAVKRLEQVEKRLNRGSHKDQYIKFMQEYEELGHMKLIPPSECGEVIGKTNYLPHHYVVRDVSSTTKLRVVFDGSAKTSSGLSFNDCLMVGPTVQDDLFTHLLRFRLKPIALKADIVKMFRQFQVPRCDQDRLRILWRESPNLPMNEYRLCTVTYGTASGPYAAARCLKQLSIDEECNFPVAATVLGRDFYVDDLLTGVQTPQEAIKLRQDLQSLLSKGNMKICKWDSNSPIVLDSIPQELCETNSHIQVENSVVSKALGVSWDSQSDVMLFSGYQFPELVRVTKRTVLSEMSRVFDPLGWLSPLTVTVKAFFQKLWNPVESHNGSISTFSWDDELPQHLQYEWISYRKGMDNIGQIKLPRCIIPLGVREYELHGFSDASEKAYSAVVYLRCFLTDGSITVNIVAAKTKVAPLKQQSIPRLELCGALLLTRLISAILTATSMQCSISAWTDSEIVLRWLSASSRRWKTFVANRVSEIQEDIPSELWRFVPGIQNPADCASRGLSVDQLVDFPLWWNGPEWLSQHQLPVFQTNPTPNMDIEEKSKSVLTHQVSQQPYNSIFLKYSCINKLKRVMSYVLRFRFNCGVKVNLRRIGELTTTELTNTMLTLVKLAQAEDFSVELKRLEMGKPILMTSKLLSLNPFLDNNGILRVGGRLQKSKMPDVSKHQVILTAQHPLSKLLIYHYHSTLHHAGFQLLWSRLQTKYWLLNARPCIRNIVRNCLKCKRLKAKVAEQLMGSLPSGRVNPSKPFLHTGVDYAGPFSLSIMKGRGMKHFKGYFCIFVCLATKAVHLEAVTDLTTEAFIASLKRFVSRRGIPSDIYSDCGSNFVGAERELKDMVSSSDHNTKMSHYFSDRGTQWHFNSPAAPHHGGLWEAGVKSVKYHLKRIMGPDSMTLEEFMTLLTQVEAALNSRPLCPLSTDPTELEVLTPGHFLVGEALVAVPEPDLTQLRVNRLSRWQRSQQVFQHFWNRWSKEYLHSLQERHKWKRTSSNISVGDLVLVKEDNLPPLKWRMGRVLIVHPGKDHLVRVVTIKTALGELQRPIVKICPLNSKSELQARC